MIPIRNIYYMLAYAFQALDQAGYRDLTTEDFDNAADLCAAILAHGVRHQLRRDLGRDYLPQTQTLSALRGRLDVTESVKTRSVLRRQMVCDYDEFSADTRMNRILKTTMTALLGADVKAPRKKELRGLLMYFRDVGTVDLARVDWHMRYDRSNQTYRVLMGVCQLVAKGLLQTQTDGPQRMMNFIDEQRMSHLYEKFILEYYRREHPELTADASYVAWALDAAGDAFLPAMRTDVTLRRGKQTLIIDAKYYQHNLQEHFGARTVHSANLYQIFAYVKNEQASLPAAAPAVSGMLLYSRTDEALQPDATYLMSGNRISVRTLDLNQDFGEIRRQLDGIVAQNFAGAH